jgi:hypothetical protein
VTRVKAALIELESTAEELAELDAVSALPSSDPNWLQEAGFPARLPSRADQQSWTFVTLRQMRW